MYMYYNVVNCMCVYIIICTSYMMVVGCVNVCVCERYIFMHMMMVGWGQSLFYTAHIAMNSLSFQ